jgi:hypothetical protein
MSSEKMPAWLGQRLQKGVFFLTAGLFLRHLRECYLGS